MIESDGGFGKLTPRELLAPERKQLTTNEDVADLFGPNYRDLIMTTVRGLGIDADLDFFGAPLSHGGSQALYLAEQYIGDHFVLVPVLGSNMRTSRHYHEAPMGSEQYFHIAGKSFIAVGSKEFILDHKNSQVEVPRGVVHQVRTEAQPALTLIVMQNARLVSLGRLHVVE